MRFLALLVLVLLPCSGCDNPSAAIAEERPVPPPDPLAGRAAFVAICATCHMSRDGFDLAYFGYPDSTIVRRALQHVPLQTARDIAAYIRTLQVETARRETRLFQPGGEVLSDDRAFAIGLFGADAWPAHMTSAELVAIDPRTVRVALQMPRWSVEHDNTDWMPDRPLPEQVSEFNGGTVHRALDAYFTSMTSESLIGALTALGEAEETAGPCVGGERVADPDSCFELRRWMAGLAALHMLRFRDQAPDPELVASWWRIGDMARRRSDRDFPNARHHAAAWLYLNWTFDPGTQRTNYLSSALNQVDLPRHATYVALRDMVVAKTGTAQVYGDFARAVKTAPPHWTADVVTFGLGELLARVGRGDVPLAAHHVALTQSHLEEAFDHARGKTTPEEFAALEGLRARLLAGLQRSGVPIDAERRSSQ